MSISSASIKNSYSQELEDKTPQEILGEEYFKKTEQKYSKIIGIVKSIVFMCDYEIEDCECGGSGNNYCADCGEALKFSHTFSQYTEYPNYTAQNEDMARERFAEKYGIEEKEFIEVRKYLLITTYFNEESYLRAKKAQDEKNIGYVKSE